MAIGSGAFISSRCRQQAGIILLVLFAAIWCGWSWNREPCISADAGRASSTCDTTTRETTAGPRSTPRSEALLARPFPRREWGQVVDAQGNVLKVELCQAKCFIGVDCGTCQPGGGEAGWDARRPIPWEMFAQGEYIGPYREAHVPEYRLRVDDNLEFIYRLTRIESAGPYELNVGDRISVESLIDPNLDRELVIQPDGTITLRMLGQVRAARRTVDELRGDLEERYKKYYKVPAITVTPLQVNTKLEDLRLGRQPVRKHRWADTAARVTPEGTIQLPAIGSVPAQGLSLDELKHEIDERYAQVVDGIEVTPKLLERAPRYVYVVGEVKSPGRFALEAPTTAMQAIALAGGWNNGGNLRQIVVFRRTEDWHLIATKLDLRRALLGERPCPADEVWLRDSDIVVLPKSYLLRADDFIELVFTRGIYGILPMQGISLNFSKFSSL